jgi:hypothetical protein
VVEATAEAGRVDLTISHETGYWSVTLEVPDSPGPIDCGELASVVFSDFFTPFSSAHADASCTIDVEQAPYTHGGRFQGAYSGTLINDVGERAERVVTGVFDVTVVE